METKLIDALERPTTNARPAPKRSAEGGSEFPGLLGATLTGDPSAASGSRSIRAERLANDSGSERLAGAEEDEARDRAEEGGTATHAAEAAAGAGTKAAGSVGDATTAIAGPAAAGTDVGGSVLATAVAGVADDGRRSTSGDADRRASDFVAEATPGRGANGADAAGDRLAPSFAGQGRGSATPVHRAATASAPTGGAAETIDRASSVAESHEGKPSDARANETDRRAPRTEAATASSHAGSPAAGIAASANSGSEGSREIAPEDRFAGTELDSVRSETTDEHGRRDQRARSYFDGYGSASDQRSDGADDVSRRPTGTALAVQDPTRDGVAPGAAIALEPDLGAYAESRSASNLHLAAAGSATAIATAASESRGDAGAPGAATPPAASDAIAVQTEWLATRGGGSVRLALHPPELGEMAIRVTLRGGAVDVVMVAQEAVAQSVAEEQSERLAQAFAGRELRMEHFEVRRGQPGELPTSDGNEFARDAGDPDRSSDGGDRQPDDGGSRSDGPGAGSVVALSGVDAAAVPRILSLGPEASVDLRI